ncbi:hypothetical protein CsSME_00046688 [Camellia sinensis var. sinensis]
MAIHHKVIITALLFALLVLARVEFSTCHVLKGSVTCLDCHNHHDLSDIKVLVKCSQVKKLAVATTSADGTFETELPSDILGGPKQLYTSKKNIVSRTLKLSNSDDSYTISKPLKFFTSNPSSSSKNAAAIGESKTVDIPLPPAWGLAPSSYYIPFVPIIGIP